MRAHHERNLWFGEPDFSCRFHIGQGWLPFHACWSLSALSGFCCSAPNICSLLPVAYGRQWACPGAECTDVGTLQMPSCAELLSFRTATRAGLSGRTARFSPLGRSVCTNLSWLTGLPSYGPLLGPFPRPSSVFPPFAPSQIQDRRLPRLFPQRSEEQDHSAPEDIEREPSLVRRLGGNRMVLRRLRAYLRSELSL